MTDATVPGVVSPGSGASSVAEPAAADAAPVGRVQRKRDRRIRQILTAAAELVGERGYEAVSLEEVAERLDVTKGSLYHYFSGKDALVTAAIETLGDDWTARLEGLPAGREGTAERRLRALLGEHVRIAVREYPAALRLFLVPSTWPADQRTRIKELRRRHDAVFRAVLNEGVAGGEFSVVSVDATLQCLHASMSQAPEWVGGLRRAEQERVLDDLVETLMKLVAR
ncbi:MULTISPECIES: TetR/AcrR family transcriptional regulator [Pseudonocardia]|uniref:HTH-type transcriptional regulator RutR n=2 Tax=Pseudonocardia TaxID=1847 RepID=A0A1Y2N9R5_PSEAH|nr:MULTISPECIES: TetR/AcrR family transcriptional regulator [Pseudonocardia]OSY44210.1 HTH-type transcriptional regulator RutR [Pseudonocardia autotrophica]TDN74060.1 TetR family transcriptional regulator [Pseudonocardia autotrophica]BBG04818.1 TetR family transcriptional regulator [Pseudonocardia autotrophica]GEC23474.1 TetR family transcriptional regulator [Pseudonocardia saturnea]